MDFMEACQALGNGKRVTRKSWDKPSHNPLGGHIPMGRYPTVRSLSVHRDRLLVHPQANEYQFTLEDVRATDWRIDE